MEFYRVYSAWESGWVCFQATIPDGEIYVWCVKISKNFHLQSQVPKNHCKAMSLFRHNLQKAKANFSRWCQFLKQMSKTFTDIQSSSKLYIILCLILFYTYAIPLWCFLSYWLSCFLSSSFTSAAILWLTQDYLFDSMISDFCWHISLFPSFPSHFCDILTFFFFVCVKCRLNFSVVSLFLLLFSVMALVSVCTSICHGDMENLIRTNLCVY